MSDELPDVPALRVIEPPTNGLAHLRAAIAEDEAKTIGRAARRRRWWALTAPVAVVLALVLWLRRDPGVEVELPQEVIVAPVADPEISPTFYWVASSPRSTPPAAAPITIVQPEQLQPTTRELH